jgi:valyl-tRNA synthetase
VKYLDLKDDLLKWGNELNWFPDFMKHRYENWVKGLQWDWLISNQRYFGIPFPVWYCEDCGEVILANEKQLPVDPLKDKPSVAKCPKCNSEKIIPETDVFNTWFTSSMTPQIVNNLIKDEKVKKKLFPMSLRPQAHEIISFWLFNTLLKSRLHFGKNPWKDAVISGYVTMKGEKMGKSKGNVIAPQEVIEKYGADALRYWAASAKLGDDFDYQEKDLVTGKKLVTKLLNASRFIFMNLEDYDGKKPKTLEPLDKLFLDKLNILVKNSTEYFEKYEYSRVKNDVDNFFWNDFCNNYLELVKKRIYQGTGNNKLSAQYTLYNSLLIILKLFAPIVPFITEKIYQENFRKKEKIKSIHICEWPKFEKIKEKTVVKKYEDNELGWDKWNLLLDLISKIRQEKSTAKKPMNAEIILTISRNLYSDLEDVLEDLKSVANAVEIKTGNFKVDFK